MSRYSGIAGKRILITGATSGLGLAMARALVKEGAKVAVGGRDQGKIDRVVSSLRAGCGECVGVLINVRDEESIQRGVAEMVQRWGGIDVLINNAGIGMGTVNPRFATDPHPFWEVSASGFRDLIDTNLTGYFLVAKAVVPYFLKAGGGRIINISTSLETMKRKGFVPYGPSRAGAESLSHIMAEDLAGRGVTVNILLPGGATDTGMLPEEFRADPEQWRVKFGVDLLHPDVMAEATLFLCSDESKSVHDERIVAKDFQQWKTDWLDRKRA
ncbi:MAG TPA: SDR family oxidoreductase [Bryobacteraceae bacterium]|jgi:gluconate 5-dehydrogenase